MMFDVQNLVCDDQDLKQNAGTYLSTYSIAIPSNGTPAVGGPLSTLIARGLPVRFVAQVTEAFKSTAGNATVTCNLVHADDAALTSNLAILSTSGAITADTDGANMPAGYCFKIGPVLPSSLTKAYFGLQFVIATAATTAGKVTAGIVSDVQVGLT